MARAWRAKAERPFLPRAALDALREPLGACWGLWWVNAPSHREAHDLVFGLWGVAIEPGYVVEDTGPHVHELWTWMPRQLDAVAWHPDTHRLAWYRGGVWRSAGKFDLGVAYP